MSFEVGAASGFFFQFEICTLDWGFLELSDSYLFYPSFWCVIIVFEVH